MRDAARVGATDEDGGAERGEPTTASHCPMIVGARDRDA